MTRLRRRRVKTYIVGISPFLQSSVKDTVFQGIVRLIVEGLPLNSKLEVYDAYNLKSITRLSVPGAKVFNSPKTRANQFASQIGEIREFLARDNAKGSGEKPMLDGAIRLPQFCDFLAQDRAQQEGDARLPLLSDRQSALPGRARTGVFDDRRLFSIGRASEGFAGGIGFRT